MKTSQLGISLIKHYESIHDGNLTKIGLQPKMCPASIWTCGWGHALYYLGKPIKGEENFYLVEKYFPQFLNMTDDQAEELLIEDLRSIENLVAVSVRRLLTQYQFDALASHTYNTGGSFNLLDLVEMHAPMEEIEAWFMNHYITVGGVKLKGLIYRRKSEFTLYKTGELKFYN